MRRAVRTSTRTFILLVLLAAWVVAGVAGISPATGSPAPERIPGPVGASPAPERIPGPVGASPAPERIPGPATESPAPPGIPKGAADPELAAVLASFGEFVRAMHQARFAEGLRWVKGVADPAKAGATFAHRVDEIHAYVAFYELSKCENNLAVLASWIEASSRDRGRLPTSLRELVPMYLTDLPECPAHGHYVYERRGKAYRIHCAGTAHRLIGVKADEPSYSSSTGLSARHAGLKLEPGVHFVVKGWSVEVVERLPAYGLYLLRLHEESSFDDTHPTKARTSLFFMSQDRGRWLVDIGLSNRDMMFVYDLERWEQESTLPKQALYYYQYLDQETRGTRKLLPGLPNRAHLELQICESNLRGLALAVENWSVQHGGAYPRDAFHQLSTLRGRLPECPSGGRYRYTLDARGRYSICCQGSAHAHAGVEADHPSVSPLGLQRGIRKKPEPPAERR